MMDQTSLYIKKPRQEDTRSDKLMADPKHNYALTMLLQRGYSTFLNSGTLKFEERMVVAPYNELLSPLKFRLSFTIRVYAYIYKFISKGEKMLPKLKVEE